MSAVPSFLQEFTRVYLYSTKNVYLQYKIGAKPVKIFNVPIKLTFEKFVFILYIFTENPMKILN